LWSLKFLFFGAHNNHHRASSAMSQSLDGARAGPGKRPPDRTH
jgi:hypothetical protein